MARSQYIYLIDDEFDRLKAAFTVKREMFDWLDAAADSGRRFVGDWTLWRTQDHPRGPASFTRLENPYAQTHTCGDSLSPP